MRSTSVVTTTVRAGVAAWLASAEVAGTPGAVGTSPACGISGDAVADGGTPSLAGSGTPSLPVSAGDAT